MSRWWLLGILVGALAVRLVVAWGWQHRLGSESAMSLPDSHSYWHLARQLATGRPYEHGGPDFRVFRAPAYPCFLAGLMRVAGTEMSAFWARAAGALLGTIAVAELMVLACLIFDRTTAMVAGLLAALYPGAIAMSVLILAEALFCPLLMLHLVCWVRAARSDRLGDRLGWSIAAGVGAGLAVLTRPSWLLFLPLAVGCSLAGRWLGGRRALTNGSTEDCRWIDRVPLSAWILVAAAVVMLPWWVRNYRATGGVVITTLQVGASLYDGWHDGATGASSMEFAQSFYDRQKAEDALRGRSAAGFEARLDASLRRAAWQWAVAHPGQVVRLAGVKFLRMWNGWPNADEFRGGALRWIVAIGYVPLLVGMVTGIWIWGRQGWPYVLLWTPALYFTLLHVVFVSSIRYRQPAMLVGTVLAAAVVVTVARRWCSQEDPVTAVTV